MATAPKIYGPNIAQWRLAAPVQTLTGAATNIDFSNLDGDVLKQVKIIVKGKNATASTVTVTLQPNSLATNQRSTGTSQVTNGAAPTGFSTTTLYLGSSYLSGVGFEFEATFWTARTGSQVRSGFSHASYANSAFTLITTDDAALVWNETSTLITSLRINSDVASAFAIGTTAELWARS